MLAFMAQWPEHLQERVICSISAAFHIIYIGLVVHTIDSPIEFNFLQNGTFYFSVAYLEVCFRGGTSL